MRALARHRMFRITCQHASRLLSQAEDETLPFGKRVRLRTALVGVEDVGEPNAYTLVQRQTVEVENEAKPAMVAESLLRVYL